MTSRATSPRRLQSQNSFKKQENGMDSPVHPGRQPLRPIPEASASKSSSASEQTEPGSPSKPPTPRGKKRAAAVYRQSENVDGNIGSASNTPEKPREKRTTLTRVTKASAPWSSKLPITASLARSLQESLQQTDVATKSWDSDSVGGTPATSHRTPLISTTGGSKSGSIEQTSRTFKISGKPPLDPDPSRTCFSSSNSSFLQSTPGRSVNRSLRYGATPGSAASIGSTRALGSGTKSSGSFHFNTGQQILAQQFDFEEDPTFWEDHNVQVILRTRPISTSESALKGFSRCVRQDNSHSITWIGQPETRFTFDHVAGDHITQEKLFRVAGVPMVENCMAGYNSCMFCYGQTGSGKTHTMLGDIVDLEHRPSDDRGITPRVFEYLFSKIQKEEESRTAEHLKYVCKCSFLEIFNEQITDLLEPSSTNLQVREGGKKGVYVENLSEVAVGSVQDVVHLLLLGAANRKVAATNLNRESSRSHSVFTCTIESKWEFNSATNIRFGRLNLVDLAGSERQKTSGAEGERLKEAANINKSLSTLGLVIMILVDVANGKQRHVPYRDSKLTYLLQDSLGGNSKTTMIANISPSSCCALETLSTLKFAQRAKFIRNNAIVNEDASGDVNGLRQEIQELKEELDRIRRQDLPRTPSMHSVSLVPQDSVRKGDDNLGMAVVAVDEQEQSRCSLDSWDFSKAFSASRFPNKKLEAMEAVLAGALRREQEAEFSEKRQAAEIEQLTRLVKQREDDSQCSKMLLRFREDKIRRLEALSSGMMSADMYLRQENDFLMNELRLMQEKADRNPELTRFAMENIRLLEQLRRFQDFYTGGEREAMADEISNLRDQLLEVLDSKLSLTALTSPQREALAPELAAAQREIELLRIETENYRREVEDCRKNLSSILEANSRITKHLDESNTELRELKLKNQVHQEELQKLRDQASDAEAIEWGHAQHLELISNLKSKLQQSEDRADREASLRFELDEQLNASLQKAVDLQADLQETRGALDAAEMLVSRLQSAESDLSVAQEMAILAQNAVRQIHLETKEIAEDQRLSLKHTEDAVVAACMKEIELREELKEAHSLIHKLSSTNDELKCSTCSVASVTENEQVQGILVRKRTVSISHLEQDLKSLDLLFESGCTHQNTCSIESARGGMENIAKICDETSTTQREESLYLEQGKDCILKLNFAEEDRQTVDDRSLLEVKPDTTRRELQDAESIMSDLQGNRDLQVLQGNNMNSVDLELVQAIRCLQEEVMKLKPQVVTEEERMAASKWSTTELVKEIESLILVVQAVREERKNLAAQNEELLKENDIAIKARQEREAATSRLLEHLNEGEHALTDAVREMEGILDDCLSQPTAVDEGSVREQGLVSVQQLGMTITPSAEKKDTDQARQAGRNDHFNDIKKRFSVCTTMLQWFSETLTAECSAKNILRMQNDRAEEELGSKDCLILSLQKQLERAMATLFEKDFLVSQLKNEYDEDRARLVKADAQITAAINVETKLLDDIENHRLELDTALKRMDDFQLELAQMQDVLMRIDDTQLDLEQMQDVLTGLRLELIGGERDRKKLAMEKEQLAAEFAYDGEVLERSCSVAATMVWWLQSKIAADEEAQKLNYNIASQVKEWDRMVLSLQDEITEKTMLLKELKGKEEILVHQNLEHLQVIDNTSKEFAEKDSLLTVMQTSLLRLQDELSVSEGRSMQLATEKENLQIRLCETAKRSEALQEVLSSVQRALQEAEAKVVELAIVQAGMLIVQEEWGLEKDGLERDTSEAKQRCTQLEQELELARNVALKFETELEVVKTQEIVLREERDKVVTSLQEELKITQTSAEAIKEQFELNKNSMTELDSRLQKHLAEWEIEKETMSSAAVLAYDKCLEKDQALTSMETCLATFQSQLHDACSRETKLSHELEEFLQSNENTQRENEMFRSKAEELVLVVNRQGQEISSLKQVLELKLQIADDKVEDTHRQMKTILLDLDALILMKEKMEDDAESIEQKVLHHCSSMEQQLINANENKNQLEQLLGERENELLGELNTVQSENASFGVRVQALEDALEDSRVLIKKKEEEILVLQRDWTESESKAVEIQEKLRASKLLMKELARSEEQLKLQTEALAAENKRLTRCMACREIEFSCLQGQIEGLEKSLEQSHEKESMTSMTLSLLKEDLKVLEKQWQVEREQLKDSLVTANRELLESQEMKRGFYNALKELEDEIMATEKKCEIIISELEAHWGIARGEMSNHLTQISLDFIEVKGSAEKTHLDLAKARSLLSAADEAIEQLLIKSSALKETNNQLFAKQEALQLELSHWEQYAVELHRSSCFVPSSFNDDNAIAVSGANLRNNYFDTLKIDVENLRHECEKLRAQVFDKDSTILLVQMELSATIASRRQAETELGCVADERSDLKIQLNSINRALVNAQDEVRCRDVELKTFEGELHKVMELLVKTEEKMDESTREWRKQIEEVKVEMEAAKLCASEKSSEVIMLRKQFEDGQATLQEAEILVNALVRANERAKRDLLKWKSREEKVTLQSSEMLSMINEEVSVTMDHVEKQLQDMSLDIHGMKTLLADIFSETAAGVDHEFKEFIRIQTSEIERAAEDAHMKLAMLNARLIDLEQRLHESVLENEALQISLNRTQDLLVGSQAALEDAMQNMELQQKGYTTTRDELQGALTSLAAKNTCISELTSECDRLSTRNAELETLFSEMFEELSTNVANSKELEMSLTDALCIKQVLEMEILSLRQQKDSHEDDTRKLEADLAASQDTVKAVATKLLETEVTIQVLNSDLEKSQNEISCVQRSLDMAVTESNDLRQHAHELEEKEVHLMAEAEKQRHVLRSNSEKLLQSEAEFDVAMEVLATMLESTSNELHAAETLKAGLEENNIRFSSVLDSLQMAVSQLEKEKWLLLERLEMQGKQLCQQSLEASAASCAHELQLEILKTIVESASRELQEKDHMIFSLQEKLEKSSARSLALDEDKKDLLERLEIQSLQLCKQSQEASAASTAHQTELESLKTIIESASRELQDRGYMTFALQEKLEQSSARCLALDEDKQDLLERLENQNLQLCKQSQEASAASTAHQTELESLRTIIESASRELQEKDDMIFALREKLEYSSARSLALDGDKKDLLERLEIQNLQLCTQSEEASAASTAHQTELESLKTIIGSASRELQEKDDMIFALQGKLEQSSGHCLALDEDKKNLLERLEIQNLQLCKQSQEASAASTAHQTELESLKTIIGSASRELQEKDEMIFALQGRLEQSSGHCLALDEDMKNLLERLEIQNLQLCTQSEEASAASTAHQTELESLKTIIESASRELQGKDEMIFALQGKLEQSSGHCLALDEDKKNLLERLEIQNLQLCTQSEEASAASTAHQTELESLKTIIGSASRELQEKDEMIFALQGKLEQSSGHCLALDEDKKNLLERLEIQNLQLCTQSEEASAASTAHQTELESLKTIIGSASRELQEKDELTFALQGKLEQSSARSLALDGDKKDLLERLEIQNLQLCTQSEEASAASTAHQTELESLKTIIGSASRELQEKDDMIFALQGKLEQSSGHCLALDEDKKNLLERLEIQNLQLCTQSEEASAASTAHQTELESLKTIIGSASRELQEKDELTFALQGKLEQSSGRCLALDEDKKNLLERLEIQNLQLCTQSEEASAASTAHQTELESLKTIIESASRELQEKDDMIFALREKLEYSSARSLALDGDKKDLLERLEIQNLQLCTQSEEASAASTAHQTELENLKTIIGSASRELQEKDDIIFALQGKLEQSSGHCLALDEDKKNLLERLEIQNLQLCKQSEEASAASTAHQIELEILRTIVESASTDLLEKDQITSSLRDNLEESSAQILKILESLEATTLASAQIEHERNDILESVNGLETENRAFREEVEIKSRRCADLELRILRLQTELQDVCTGSCEQKLELEILATMLEIAVQESIEKDAMASDLENLLSQSQLQNAEMLQSSQEVVNHFSLFQSQLDACFQQNKELEKNKLVLTAEVYSQSQEIVELKELRQASEKCLDELRTSFSQLENHKDEELRLLSDEVEKLKSQEAAMEVDLWDWEQRCQDTEVQLDEKVSELEILRGKLLATQEECKEQLELGYDELRECQRRIAEMDSERRDLINEIEDGSSIVADLQAKLQIRENEMEEHFSRHSIEQEVFDSLENEKRELLSSVNHLTAEVAANQQRATAAENLQIETRLEMEALERDLKQKDDLLQSLESDLNLLQESALQELRLNQELDSLRVTTDALQQELNLQKERRAKLEIEIGQVTEEIVQTRNQAATWKGKAYELETELDKNRQTIESLEDELRMAEQNMANTLEEATIDLKEVENEKDRLQIEVLELTEQLEMTQTMVEERDAVVSELHQAEELSRTHAKEKEDEAMLLTRSVHELESTVYALESQLGLLKREAERQRLLREDIEMESQKLNNHIFVTQSAFEESNTRSAEELKDALSALKETERKVEEKESDILHLRRKLENLEIVSKDKDVQINDAMAQISDLLLAAEIQKADVQQKLKRMESGVERSKTVNQSTNPARESFSQSDMTHVSCQSRIQELEELASSRQKEVFMLHSRLAEAESMTHDVLRDLLGVKTDMNNVVSMLDHQQIKQLAETACRKNVEAEEMETELSSLRSQLNTYIEERESWVEEINLRQCEMVAARVAAEKLRQKEQLLTDEIEKFRIENINHQEKITELEMEIRKLPTGQQTFYQQISHHAKIKEENQALKLANEELTKELRRTELLYAGMHDELVRYRSTESKSASPSFDEERLHLRHLLQEAENSRAQAAQKLSSLCTSILQAAGLSVSETVDSSGAMEALQLLENRLRTSEQELSESKYKMKLTGERRRRSDIRAKDSPLRSISNFTDLLQRVSSPSPAPR